jgi:hypothetical protein
LKGWIDDGDQTLLEFQLSSSIVSRIGDGDRSNDEILIGEKEKTIRREDGWKLVAETKVGIGGGAETTSRLSISKGNLRTNGQA